MTAPLSPRRPSTRPSSAPLPGTPDSVPGPESLEAWRWLEARPRRWAAPDWPAGSIWTWSGLRQRYGDRMVLVSDTLHEDAPTSIRLDEFIDYCQGGPYPRPRYLHWWFGPDAPELTRSLHRPWYLRCWFDRLPVSLDPELRWLLAGPAGSGTAWHRDIFRTSAWCHLLAGVKRWELREPGDGDAPSSPGPAARVRSLIQGPGETVYVPSGWPHRVENLEPTLALSGNLLNPGNWRAVHRAVAVERPSWAPIVTRLAERLA